MTFFLPRLLVRISEPAAEPVTLAEAKLYLHMDSNTEDALIVDLILAARIAAEEYLSQSLITQSWKLAFDDAAPECLGLPRGPVQSVTQVKSIDKTGVETVISSSVYHLNAARNTLLFDAQVQGFRVEIEYGAGYGDAAAVPQAIKQGMLAHIAALYENRGEGGSLPVAALMLYQPFREVRI